MSNGDNVKNCKKCGKETNGKYEYCKQCYKELKVEKKNNKVQEKEPEEKVPEKEEPKKITEIKSILIKPHEGESTELLIKHEFEKETKKIIGRLSTSLTFLSILLFLITALTLIGTVYFILNFSAIENFIKEIIDYALISASA